MVRPVVVVLDMVGVPRSAMAACAWPGKTQMALDGALGASPGTVGRWERGSIVQPAVADRLMRLLWTHPDLLVEVVQPVAREARGPYRPRSGKRDIE
ncbi:MAG: helix-turn-helix domain-containing protein [Coriobacteriia bacterium]